MPSTPPMPSTTRMKNTASMRTRPTAGGGWLASRGIVLLVLMVLVVMAAAGRAADWPDWRGPNENRRSVGSQPLITSFDPEKGTNVLW